MAFRCVYTPSSSGARFDEKLIEFNYVAGMSKVQKIRSASNLHEAIIGLFPNQKVLEVSSYSMNPLGASLSAFNLNLSLQDGTRATVESVFQASKRFSHGGPYTDLLFKSSIDAKRDPRLKESGELRDFLLGDETWPLSTGTSFYDYLYLKALHQNPKLLEQLLEFEIFSDFASNKTKLGFQEGKSFASQARSCAIAVSLSTSGELDEAIKSRDDFLKLTRQDPEVEHGQLTLF